MPIPNDPLLAGDFTAQWFVVDPAGAQGIAASQVSQLLATNGIALEQLVSARATLEEAYFRLTRDAEEHSGMAVDQSEAGR